MARGRISSTELSFLVSGFIIASALVIATTVKARQDAWLAILLAISAGLGSVVLYINLSARYPGKTLVEYTPLILGSVAGKIVGLLYVWFCLYLGALVTRDFAEYMVTTLMPETPFSLFPMVIGLLVGLVVKQGLEVLARTTQFILPLVIAVVLGTIVFLAPEFEPGNFLPVLEHGLGSVFYDGLYLYTLPFGETVLFTMILPCVFPVQQRRRGIIAGLLLGAFVLLIIAIITIGVLGPALAHLFIFPTSTIFGYTSVGMLMERLDAFYVAIFLIASYIKVAVCLYAASLGLGQWLNLQDYRPLVWPMVLMMVSLAILAYDNILELIYFVSTIWPFYALPFQLFIPLFLLVVSAFRRTRRGENL